ncbi:alpha-1,2-mannosyltransferase ALG9-like [Cebus imitator]|uniref:alpha-1,2-mannosyltransferase ALG9-like n=1 Tax=Cebus imitator TaxID=2715852 RepID=UPI00189751B9|nr:alpha-1,2-mannosyltransferase ALG9-like [Cebus imitator]
MASRGARQRLKGSGGSGGDTAPAADKLRELLGSREAGGAEHRTEHTTSSTGRGFRLGNIPQHMPFAPMLICYFMPGQLHFMQEFYKLIRFLSFTFCDVFWLL